MHAVFYLNQSGAFTIPCFDPPPLVFFCSELWSGRELESNRLVVAEFGFPPLAKNGGLLERVVALGLVPVQHCNALRIVLIVSPPSFSSYIVR